MSESKGESEHGGVSVRTLEIVVAAALMGLAAMVMYDNWMTGARWGADGPQAGYFPFYIALLMLISAGMVLLRALTLAAPRRRFVEPSKFRPVLALLIPSMVYVVFAAYLGVYVAAAIYLTYFMFVVGRYKAAVVAPVAIGVPIVLFLLFEVWFLVPLPKGPLEYWLGY